MTTESGKCPYCGEDILAAAKKCKHCGEWLAPQKTESETLLSPSCTTEKESPTERPLSPIPSKHSGINPEWLGLICWTTIFTTIISSSQTLLESCPHLKGKFLWGACLWIARSVPEWLVIIADGTLWVLLIMSLRTLFQRYAPAKKAPFIALICLMIGLYLCTLIACFIEDEDISATFSLLFGIPLIITVQILTFITGIRFREFTPFRFFGTLLMIYAVAPILLLIVELGLGETELIFSTIIICGFEVYMLYKMRETFLSVA